MKNSSSQFTQILEDPISDTQLIYDNQALQLELIPYGKIIHDHKMPVLLEVHIQIVSNPSKDFIFFIDQNLRSQYVQFIRDLLDCIITKLEPKDRIGINCGAQIHLVLNSNDKAQLIQNMINSIIIDDQNFNMFQNIKKLISQMEQRKYKNQETWLLVFSNETKDVDLFNEALGGKLYQTFHKMFNMVVNEETFIEQNQKYDNYDRVYLKGLTDLIMHEMHLPKEWISQNSITVNIEQTYFNEQAQYGTQQIAKYQFENIRYEMSIRELIFIDISPPSEGDQVQLTATLNGVSKKQNIQKNTVLLYNPLKTYTINENIELDCLLFIIQQLHDEIDQLAPDNMMHKVEQLIVVADTKLQFLEYESSIQFKIFSLQNIRMQYRTMNQHELAQQIMQGQSNQQNEISKKTGDSSQSHNYQPNIDENLSSRNLNDKLIQMNLRSERQVNSVGNTYNISNNSHQSQIPSEYLHSVEHICKRADRRFEKNVIIMEINLPQQVEECTLELNFIDENGYHYKGQGNLPNMKNGFGVLSQKDQEIYSGFWKDDLFHGQGNLYNQGYSQVQWLYYVGSFEDGKMDGEGIMYFMNGSTYKGGFTQGKANEFDLFIQQYIQSAQEQWDLQHINLINLIKNETIVAKSRFRDQSQIQDGFGILEDEEGNSIYSGSWKNQSYDGFGIECNRAIKYKVNDQEHYDWIKYIGQYKDGAKSGIGLIEYLDGALYFGEIDNNRIKGYGKIHSVQNEDIYNFYN